MTPSDQPTWGQSLRASVKQLWPMLWVYPATYVVCWLMFRYINMPDKYDWKTIGLMMGLISIMLLLMTLNGILQFRWQETPSQREEREKALLAKLKEKYES